MKRVAVVGAGIAGLATAHALASEACVTLFEAGCYFGGHAHTVDVTIDGIAHGVDTGFLVFNPATYPSLVRLFDALGVATAAAEMSFSVQVADSGLEWSGCNLNTLFAQRRNLASPRFLGMLAEILRFNRLASGLARRSADLAGAAGATELAEPIGEFLARHAFGAAFREWYFLPMIACIWSCPTAQMLRFPVVTMLRFCHNHGLLQATGRPQWRTVRGGAKHYVSKLLRQIPDARLNSPLRSVRRLPPQAGGDNGSGGSGGVMVATEHGSERFDEVVLACHSTQSLALLAQALPAERALLSAIRYHANRAVLHTDSAVLPRRRRAWAAWNYPRAAATGREPAGEPAAESTGVCLHYLINRLQPLPWPRPVLVSLNPDPARAPDPARVIGAYEYSHPVFDLAAIRAQQELPAIQGHGHVWYCGAWTRHGFHEDGLMSALDVAQRLRKRWRNEAAGRPHEACHDA